VDLIPTGDYYGNECDDLVTDATCTQFCAPGYIDNNNNDGQAYTCPNGVFTGSLIDCDEAAFCPAVPISNLTKDLGSFDVSAVIGTASVTFGYANGFTSDSVKITCTAGFYSANGLNFTISCDGIAPGASEWTNVLMCGFAVVVELHWHDSILTSDELDSLVLAIRATTENVLSYEMGTSYEITDETELVVTMVFGDASSQAFALDALNDVDFSGFGEPEVFIFDPNPEPFVSGSHVAAPMVQALVAFLFAMQM